MRALVVIRESNRRPKQNTFTIANAANRSSELRLHNRLQSVSPQFERQSFFVAILV